MTYQRYLKRLFDIISSAIALLVFSPLMLFVTFLYFVIEGRPVFYKSVRYITLDRAITIYKFRTMFRDALSSKYDLEKRFMKNGFLDIPLDCEVYTPFGRILERFQIVEFLQFYNVLFHRMSIVGNRPLPKANLDLLSKFKNWEERFGAPAGISGISQIVGKFNLEPEQRLKLEVLYSKVYQEGKVFICDLWIIYYTLKFVLLNKNLTIDEAVIFLNKYLK
jgi:lipopolysaccharide/colanic/teichoic acid biosynthesis glycosyltransferase